jgi:superfamily II DNA/RNA helicase
MDAEEINDEMDSDEEIDNEELDNEELDEGEINEEEINEEENNQINNDDPEDELINKVKYTEIIKNLSKYKNNVYLSATIDRIEGFEYYSKDIRYMIDKNYLCDYTIHIPIFTEDPTNKNIGEHLIKNYRNVIVYCNSQKEGKEINKLMNQLQSNCSEYIDCKTAKRTRDKIIEKYKNGNVSFLVNVRILVEGFDSPITQGVCFLHLPSKGNTIIQIIGRALRLHPLKTIANIILPFSSNDDEKQICKFLNILAKNDTRIKKSYENKKTGGYISIIKAEENIEDNEDLEMKLDFKYNMIYNSMGILQNRFEIWNKKLEEVKTYIDDNNKIPTGCNKNKYIKKMAMWLSTQKKTYKKKSCIMTNKNICDEWDKFINNKKYVKYFITNEQLWYNNLEKVKFYMDKNYKRPSSEDKDKIIKAYGMWILDNLKNHKIKYKIMSNAKIYNEWINFINDEKYKKYLMTRGCEWYEKLNTVKKYIDVNNIKPSQITKDIHVRILGKWISQQINNYKQKLCAMKNEKIYDEWTNFINDEKYKKYLNTNEDKWYENLLLIRNYIDKYNKLPSIKDKTNNKLTKWMYRQNEKYRKKSHNMIDDTIYNEWRNFISDDKYKKFFTLHNINYDIKQ